MCWRAGFSAHAAARFAGEYKGIECSNGCFIYFYLPAQEGGIDTAQG
jgi:hypothetical protein